MILRIERENPNQFVVVTEEGDHISLPFPTVDAAEAFKSGWNTAMSRLRWLLDAPSVDDLQDEDD